MRNYTLIEFSFEYNQLIVYYIDIYQLVYLDMVKLQLDEYSYNNCDLVQVLVLEHIHYISKYLDKLDE